MKGYLAMVMVLRCYLWIALRASDLSSAFDGEALQAILLDPLIGCDAEAVTF
jgi:hypothetical protein